MWRISYWAHNFVFKDKKQTLCSRAHEKDYDGFWYMFSIAKKHCANSYNNWN